MNMQERMIEKRTFRIVVIAVVAAAVLVIAAYLFGTGLQAGTSASPAALAKSRADFYADLNNSAAAARSASLAALAKSRSDFYADLNNSAAAARSRCDWQRSGRISMPT